MGKWKLAEQHLGKSEAKNQKGVGDDHGMEFEMASHKHLQQELGFLAPETPGETMEPK